MMSDPAPAGGGFSLHPAMPITILATSLGFVLVQLDGSILNVAVGADRHLARDQCRWPAMDS